MSIKIAINGFGRIGRLVFRAACFRDESDIVAINAPDKSAEMVVYAAKYDTVHGRFNGEIKAGEDESIVANGKNIPLLDQRDPAKLPWAEMGVDYVIECTGAFLTKESAQPSGCRS